MTSRLIPLALGLLLLGSPALAADPLPAPKLLTVDIDTLSEQSLAIKDLSAKVEAARQAFQDDLAAKYQALEDELRAFRVEAAAMPARERGDREAKIRRDIADLELRKADGLAAIDARGQESMDSMQGEFRAVIALVAESLEVDMVISTAAYSELRASGTVEQGAEDVTPVVLAFLNQRLPESNFSMDEKAITP